MARVNPAEYAEKWARRTSQASEDYRKGIERTTESPMEKAAAAQDKMLANLIESVNSGKWARALRNVTIAEWKDGALRKGVQRIAAGVQNATEKQRQMAQRLLETVDRGLSEIEQMPSTTFEDRKARANAWMDFMHANPVK